MKLIRIIASFIVVLFVGMALATPPVNLAKIKQELLAYCQSGQYDRDLAATYKKATAYLQQRINSNHGKRLAVVMDIDETSLSNLPDMEKESFGGTEKQLDQAMMKAQDPAIKPALKFFNFAKQHHVAIFFVTGRNEYMRAATIKNLHQAGFSGWQALYLTPNNYAKSSIIPFKSAERHKIELQGYDIVLTIGDQWSDLKGGYADRYFKLVDPFYFIS